MSAPDTGDRHALILVPHGIDPTAPKLEGECSIGLFDPTDRDDFEAAVGHLRERAFKVPYPDAREKVWRNYVVITKEPDSRHSDQVQIHACESVWVEGSDTNELEFQGDDGRVVGYFRYVTAFYEKPEEEA